jgi:hypothetical protein
MRMRRTSAATASLEEPDEVGDIDAADVQEASVRDRSTDDEEARRTVPSHARLWGFVRRGRMERGEKAELSISDTSLWLDRERCRFLIVAEKVIKDDLAPVEFVQFVRELRHSTSQVLFKFEMRHDGTVGRPFCVWPS